MVFSNRLLLKVFGCFSLIVFITYSANNLIGYSHAHYYGSLPSNLPAGLVGSTHPHFAAKTKANSRRWPNRYQHGYLKNRSIDNHSKQMLEFVSVTNELDINVFVIDPFINYQLINESERKLLIDRSLLSVDNLIELKNEKQFCVSFGVLIDHLWQIKTKLSPALKNLSFTEIAIKGKDGSKRNISVDELDLKDVLLHLFYIKANDCIQITVLHERNNFLWIGAINRFQSKAVPKHYYFGQFDAAFDPIYVKKSAELSYKKKRIKLLVPDNQVYFLSQLESSRFIECNYDLARSFNDKYKTIAQDTELNDKVREGLLMMKIMTTNLIIPFFIACGTLLGWYRQCGVISYTTDLDTGSWSTYATRDTIDQFINNEVGFRMKYLFGLPENGLELAVMTPSDLKVDLFFLYPEGDKLSVTGHIVPDRSYRRYYYPKFTLCSAELEGIKVLAACNPEEVLQSEYGRHWTEPNKAWDWDKSPRNAGPLIKWPEDIDFSTVFKEFS